MGWRHVSRERKGGRGGWQKLFPRGAPAGARTFGGDSADENVSPCELARRRGQVHERGASFTSPSPMLLWLRKSGAAWLALARVAPLVVVTALIWCAHYDRWTRGSWSLPTDYSGDAHEILAQIKAASEGAMWPLRPKVVERLGAPFGAQWNGYPTPDKPLMLVLGVLARRIGLFPAANLALLFAPISAALAFYFAARWLRCRWEWAWAGALLFAFTYHTLHRGLAHFSITFSWTVPLGLLAVWLVAKSRRLEWRGAGAIVCLGVAIGLGFSNPYNLFFWLQLMTWAVIAQWLGERRVANLQIGAASIGVAGLVFIAANIEVWLFVQEPAGAPLVARNYGGTEMYALKPMEMFLPPVFHRWDAMTFLAHRYFRWSVWHGEPFFPYLGVVGIAGLLWLLGLAARRALTRRPLPGQALSIGWLVTYAAMGGVTNVIALVAGFQIFRATNRVAVFISALVLVFLVVRLARVTARWPAWASIAAALGIASLGVLDQVPRGPTPAEKAEIVRAVTGDREFARTLEAALPAGAMVFQLPVVGFPEVVPPHQLADYELFRPFLHTENLRFSYGAAKFRSRSRWQHEVENLPAPALVRRLESYGFAALYINRKGYPDRAERLIGELAQLGYAARFESPLRQQVVVPLRPSPSPVPPPSHAVTFGRGWLARIEAGVRWANGDAVISYYNPHPRPLKAELRLTLVGVDSRELELNRKGERLATIRVGPTPITFDLPRLTLEPGVNVFTLRSRAAPVRLDNARYGLRAFGLQASSLKVSSNGLLAIDDSI